MTADEVFNILKEYYKRHKKFPTVEEFADYSEYSVEVIIKLYKRF